ncbi:MAG: glycerol-3-phosphate dehydrogenase [Pseudomonadota bacterium]|nr:glycerol-3-phosphate dehydrogenase [Pseudomonadota bacterium]
MANNTTTTLPDVVDLLIVGGGVNGTGTARDAVGRGLSVLLCEKDDLAQGTSSRSGKLIHGGLRYLEYYEFRLVRESLTEREVVMRMAPHIVWPMRFVLPHNKGTRPAWLVRLGLFLYDHLGGRERLPGTRSINLRKDPEGKPLKPEFTKAFEYSDCWCDDARLVVLNALSAAEKGATILTRTAFVGARRDGKVWRADLQDRRSGQVRQVSARAIVNLAGPWVDDVLGVAQGVKSTRRVREVKGSHIVVPKFWDGPQAYLVQNTDKRVIFINPYEGKYALIGTTDITYKGDVDQVQIDDSEVDYLCNVVNRYFVKPISPADVVYKFSGVRPLLEDEADNPSAVTRDYQIDIDGDQSTPVFLSVFGGKLTTYRKLAKHALERLQPFFPQMGKPWTDQEPLPGGDMPNADFDAYLKQFSAEHSWLPADLVRHYLRRYGTRARRIVQGAKSLADLGTHFGGHCHERELRYLVDEEWAEEAEDVLWRRTKHGLHLTPAERDAVGRWLAQNVPAAAAGPRSASA